MTDETKITPRDPGSNGNVEIFSPRLANSRHRAFSARAAPLRLPADSAQTPVADPHVPAAVVTIVSIATFRMKPVYMASAKIEIDKAGYQYPAVSGPRIL